MSIVSVDERGRLTLPKKTGVRKTRAIVIPSGSFIIVIPLPSKPASESRNWLKTKKDRRELKRIAERLVRQDAVKRAKRRRQL